MKNENNTPQKEPVALPHAAYLSLYFEHGNDPAALVHWHDTSSPGGYALENIGEYPS